MMNGVFIRKQEGFKLFFAYLITRGIEVMNLLTYILKFNVLFAFILGASVASFLHVIAKSMPIKQNWWSRRSSCPYCQTMLTPLQLLPIFSFLIQKGHCKSCHAPISTLYPLAEITGGLLFASSLIFLPSLNLYLFQTWLFFSLLLIVTLTDLYYQLIPNKILIAFGMPLFLIGPNIATAITGFLFFYGVALIGKILFKKDTLGGGDIKLYFAIGLVLSMRALFLAITISSATALLYVLIFSKNRHAPLPFAPFIALGSIIAHFLSMF